MENTLKIENTDVVRNGEKHTPYFDMVDDEVINGPNTMYDMRENIISSEEKQDCGKYEMVNHPTHYNKYSVEVIDMMERIWGVENTALWCEMTAFKYRMRLGTKPDNPIHQDLEKEEWYIKKAKELRRKDAVNPNKKILK